MSGPRTIDLNADLGEGFGVWRLGDDDALLGLVTSANVACGFHAGDPPTLRRVAARAAEQGVRVGALCVVDTKPRRFSRAEASLLRDLALQVQAVLWAGARTRNRS